MSEQPVTAVVDGIASVASHNGVHRVVAYKLDADGKAHSTVELVIPGPALVGLLDALQKVKSLR